MTNSDRAMIPELGAWDAVVGRLILNFGTLEFLILVYLQKILPAGEYERLRTRPFKERVDRAGELFANTSEKREAFERFQQRLTPVRIGPKGSGFNV